MLNKYPRLCCSDRQSLILAKPHVASCCGVGRSATIDNIHTSLPESIRVRAQLCSPYVAPGYSSSKCIPGASDSAASITVSPGTDAPVAVRTFSASEYTQLLGIQTLNAATNIANPDARFQQYFPETTPAPLSVVCPERVPNPATVRDRGCVAQSLFAPSVEGGPIA
jgi:hypothetical protein